MVLKHLSECNVFTSSRNHIILDTKLQFILYRRHSPCPLLLLGEIIGVYCESYLKRPYTLRRQNVNIPSVTASGRPIDITQFMPLCGVASDFCGHVQVLFEVVQFLSTGISFPYNSTLYFINWSVNRCFKLHLIHLIIIITIIIIVITWRYSPT